MTSIIEKIKMLLTPEDDEDENGVQEYEPNETPRVKRSTAAKLAQKDNDREYGKNPVGQGVQREELTYGKSGYRIVERLSREFEIVVVKPKSYDECPKLIDALKEHKPVIVNLESIDDDSARRAYDFLSGGVYALNGKVQTIAQKTYLFFPENVCISADPGQSPASSIKDITDLWK